MKDQRPRSLKIIILLCIILAASPYKYAYGESSKQNEYSSIDYHLSPKLAATPYLEVTANIKGRFFSGDMVIELPYIWAGTDYRPQIKNIKIEPQDYKFNISKIGHHQLSIKIPQEIKEIKILYEVHQKKDDPSDIYIPIIRSDLVHSPGYGIFALPFDLHGNHEIQISANWHDAPRGWQYISSHGTKKEIKPTTTNSLRHGIYAAGKIRMCQIGSDSSPVFLSLYGKFDVKDDKISSDIKQIIQDQREFFNDFDFPYYAMSIIEGDKPRSMEGTRLTNSFTAFLPNQLSELDYHRTLLAHEHLHNWIGGKISNNELEELNYWFTEGFTEYYTRLIQVRAGQISFEDFIKEINEFLTNYYLSPVAAEPNSRIKKDFWNNYDVEKLPYYRGFVFAIYLNDLIKKTNSKNSLDNILFELFEFSKQQNFSVELFTKIANKHTRGNIDADISKFIDQGNIINLDGVNLPVDKDRVYQIQKALSPTQIEQIKSFFDIRNKN